MIWWLLAMLWFMGGLELSAHILLNKREPRAAALWMALVWIPVIGFLLYWAFGVNRVERKARLRSSASAVRSVTVASKNHVPSDPIPDLSVGLQELVRVGDDVVRRPLCPGNQVQLLINGDETYPAMLDAIKGARHTVGFCSYIFDKDAQGRDFMDALCSAARRGVKVRFLVDGVGAWGLGPEVRRELLAAGGKIVSFWRRGRWLKHPGLNLRNHRKILVVDGQIGFTGGINISQRHMAPPEKPKLASDHTGDNPGNTPMDDDLPRPFPETEADRRDASRPSRPLSSDLHFCIRGPVVAHLAEAFTDDWYLATGEVLDGPEWFPPLASEGNVIARGIVSGPDDDEMWRIYELLLGALRSATERVDLMTPYFIPDIAILTALGTASRAGIKVTLWLPRETDHVFMHWAARAYLRDLVDRGVDIREVSGTFIHSKLAVVDGAWVLFGSANLDPRSFRLNFEFNVEAYSKELASQVTAYMKDFYDESVQIKPGSLDREPSSVRLRNAFFKLFSPFM